MKSREDNPTFGRRVVRFRLDARTLTEMLKLPDGCYVELIREDRYGNGFMVFVAGEQFDAVPPAFEIPEVMVEMGYVDGYGVEVKFIGVEDPSTCHGTGVK